MRYTFYTLSCATISEGGGIYEYFIENDKITAGKYFPCDRPMYAISEGDKMHVILRDIGNTHSGYFTIDFDFQNQSKVMDTKGIVACHLCANGDDQYIVNYLSGNIVKNGKVIDTHTGSGPNKARQNAPHTHFASFSEDKLHVLCCDLGIDTLFVYNRDLQVEQMVKVPDGYGIRHFVFSKDNKYLYTVNELVPSVSVFSYENGKLTYLSTFPLTADSEIPKGGAIRLSQDGTKLYVSVRGDDYTAVLDVKGDQLKILQKVSSHGMGPRDIYLLGDEYFVSCNEQSNNTVIFKLKDGLIKEVVADIEIKGSLCCFDR